jgi:ZIP family zinc transporter
VASVLIEGIPDALAIGLILIIGGPISIALVISIFLANLFEGLSGAESMKLGKWGKKSIFHVWILVVLLSPICAMLGYIIFSNTDHHILSLALGISSGAIISMIADTMLPQAFNETQEFTGTIMGLGFLTSFILSHSI